MNRHSPPSPPLAIAALLDRLHERGDAPALIEVRDETLTVHAFASLAIRARALAHGLRAAGLAEGERRYGRQTAPPG